MLRKYLLFFLLLGAGNAAAELQPFTAVYEVRHSGARVGKMTVVLEPGATPGSFRYTARTTPKGLAALVRRSDVVEVSEFVVNNDLLQPIEYDFDEGTRKGKRNSQIEFDWDAGNAVSQYKGETKTFALDGSPVDRLTMQLLLMRDLARDALAPSYAIIDRNARKEYSIAKVGEELIETPNGQIPAVKLRRQREGSSRSSLLWLAEKLDYLPVKIVQLKDGKTNAVMQLTSVDGL